MLRIAQTFIVVILLATVGVAQRGGGAALQADVGPFGALRWRSLGPPRGGRSIAVAGSASRPYEYYMGATGGGLWRTTDGGTTWRPVTDGLIHSSLESLAAHRSQEGARQKRHLLSEGRRDVPSPSTMPFAGQ